MNRRAEVEIVINTRWVERAFWLLIIAAITGFFLWQGQNNDYEGAAQDLARIAELETTITQKDDNLATLRVQIGLLEARVEDLQDELAEASKTPTPAAPAPEPEPEGILNAAWLHEGEFVSSNQYRLTDVTIYVTNTYPKPTSLRYELCWSSIDCENVVSRGTFSAATGDTTFDVPVTIPRFVDTDEQRQRLLLTVYQGASVIHSSERAIT